jgi:Arc/MetJ-type ribon-helix-helix transcriptional regulator
MTDPNTRRIAKMNAEDPTLASRFEKAEHAPLLKSASELFDESAGAPKGRKVPEKVVRDTFSMPESDHKLITELRLIMTRSDGTQLNKSEVVRAALRTLRRLPEQVIHEAAAEMESSGARR